MSAIVIAFDGVLADTLAIRTQAIEAIASREGVSIAVDRAAEVVPGNSLFEAISALVSPSDQSLVDLLTIGAQQLISRRLAQGIDLAEGARAWIDRQRAANSRVVLRADSIRRDVDRVLQLTELEHAFAFTRCADDLPRLTGKSSLESAYAAISIRLDGLRISTGRSAVEVTESGAAVARTVLGTATAMRHSPDIFKESTQG